MKYAIPLVISIGLCYLLFTGIDFGEMTAVIRRDCDFSFIALAMALSLLSYLFRALRWRIQLKALGIRPPLFYLVLSIFGTYAVNLVFPRLGEIWRSGYIAKRQDAPFSEVFGSMVAERLADTVTVALITLAAFVLASGAIGDYLAQNQALYDFVVSMLTSPWLWGALIAAGALTWWLLRRYAASRAVRSLKSFLRGLWDGFAVIATMPGKGRWLLWTICLWGCYFSTMYIEFFAFPSTSGAMERYGLSAVLVTFAVSSLSMGVPSNGGIGPWQWAVIFALSIYGVGATQSGAFANVVLGCQTLVQIVLGIITFVLIAADRNHRRRQHKTLTSDII